MASTPAFGTVLAAMSITVAVDLDRDADAFGELDTRAQEEWLRAALASGRATVDLSQAHLDELGVGIITDAEIDEPSLHELRADAEADSPTLRMLHCDRHEPHLILGFRIRVEHDESLSTGDSVFAACNHAAPGFGEGTVFRNEDGTAWVMLNGSAPVQDDL